MLVRILRFIVGMLLLPVCWAATLIVVELVKLVQPESAALVPHSAMALAGGFFLWILIFVLLPRPVRTYVLAHELTHALWGIFRGAKVKKIRIAKDEGSVTLTKSDFLITLAPYFFPLYTVIVILVYYLMSFFVNMAPYELYWLGLVGFTWSFHFSFTITTLMQEQSDIRECGHLFSYSVIYLFNIVGIALWTVMVSTVTLDEAMNAVVSQGSFVIEQISGIIITIKS